MQRTRCLLVGTGLTATAWGAVAVLARSAAGPAPTPTDAVVRLCLLALAVATLGLWAQALAGVADAWRGTRPARAGWARRVALSACGAAVVGATALGGVAQAAPGDPLDGLPLPERATGASPAPPAAPAAPAGATVRVRSGDSLWAIAERTLRGPGDASPCDQRVAARVQRLYATNRAVVGPDPDLVLPGQVLRLSTGISEEQP